MRTRMWLIAILATCWCVAGIAVEGNSCLYGVGAHLTEDEYADRDRTLDFLSELGAGCVRMDMLWRVCEPKPGEWDFSRFDAVVAAAESRRIRVLGILIGEPQEAMPASEHLDRWTNYVHRLVARYRGRVEAWEVLNEINGKAPYAGNPSLYVDVLRASHAAIKAEDPAAKVVLTGFIGGGYDFVEAIHKAGAADYYDVFNCHPYVLPNRPEGFVDDSLARYRKILEKYGCAGRPVWFTEIGWSTQKPHIPLRDPFVISRGLDLIDGGRKNRRILYVTEGSGRPPLSTQAAVECLRGILPEAEVDWCEADDLVLRLSERRPDAVVMPFGEEYAACVVEPLLEYLKTGGTMVDFGGATFSYAWHRLPSGQCVRDEQATGCFNVSRRFRISPEADFSNPKMPGSIQVFPTAALGDVKLPVKPLWANRFYSSRYLRDGDEFIPLLANTTKDGTIAAVSGVYRFDSDWKGAIVVSGFFNGVGSDGCSAVDEGHQADFLVRTYELCHEKGVDRCFWYEMRSPGLDDRDQESHFGLLQRDFRKKPAFAAYHTFIKIRPAGSQSRPGVCVQENVHYPQWTRPDGTKAGMLWTVGRQESVELTFDGPVSFFDRSGRAKQLLQTDDRYRVMLSGTPLYFVGAFIERIQR